MNDKVKEIELRVAHMGVARALEELFFCSLHPELVGTDRRENAIRTYADVSVKLDQLRAQT